MIVNLTEIQTALLHMTTQLVNKEAADFVLLRSAAL